MNQKTHLEIRCGVRPGRLLVCFAAPIVFLVLIHLVGQFSVFHFGVPNNRLVQSLNLDNEKSLPTFFVMVEWLTCVVLLATISLYKKKERSHFYHWLGILTLFVFLAADEHIAIHEAIMIPIRATLGASGLLFFAWIIPYSLALLVLAAVYLKFMIALPAKTRWLFVLACLIFLSGAIGVELFEGRYVEEFGRDAVYALFFVTVEETCEMVGLCLFIYALSSYLVTELNLSEIRLGPARHPQANA